MTNIVMENFREQLRQYIANNGRHMSGVISKPNGEITRLYVLFENMKLFSLTCFVLFLLPFKIWESILPHPVRELTCQDTVVVSLQAGRQPTTLCARKK